MYYSYLAITKTMHLNKILQQEILLGNKKAYKYVEVIIEALQK